MDKKKILIVCSSFYPENTPRSFRAMELAKEFSRQGHTVTVLLPDKNRLHEVFEEEHRLTIHNMGKLSWRNPNFGISKYGKLLNRAVSRLLSLSMEFPAIELMFLVTKALKKEQNNDVLISIAVPYPIHWGVAKAWKKNQRIAKTWVADCGDPYMGNTTDSFRKWFYFTWVEKWFMRKVDFVTIPVESAREAYYPEFHSKIRIIPQGFQIEKTDYSEFYKKNEIPYFMYAGGFIPGIRDPRPFLDYLCSINDDFKFFIYTNNRLLIDVYQDKLKDKLIISNYIPRDALLEKLGSMDFIVNFDNNTSTALPSKLIDYSISGRPVLNITKEADTDKIDRFLKGDYIGKMEFPDIDNYRIENVCQAFINLTDATK